MREIAVAVLIGVATLPVIAAEDLKVSDKTFAEKVAIDGMTEVEVGQMGADHSAGSESLFGGRRLGRTA